MKKYFNINHMLVIFCVLLMGLVWLISSEQHPEYATEYQKIKSIAHPNEAAMPK